MATQSVVPPHTNGDGMNQLLQQLLNASQNRDAAIERIANSVHNLSGEFNRKLDEVERDTRKQFESFATAIASQFRDITSKFEAAMSTRDSKLESVSGEFLKSRQAPWMQLIALGGLLITIGGAIGWMAYAPVLDRVDRVEVAFTKMVDAQLAMREFVSANFVTTKDLEFRSDRGKEDRERSNRAIEAIQNNTFPREVHQTRWAAFDNQFSAINVRLDTFNQNLQREIDVLQKGMGDTYTARDALLDNRKRIEDLETRIRELTGNNITRSSGGLP